MLASRARIATPKCRRWLTTAAQQISSEEPHVQLSRRAAIQHAKPFSDFLTDGFQRQHDYLRISLTERCNLRCLYCMPEEGVELSPNRDILTTPEIEYLSSVFVNQGVTKIRLTGGEPTVRKDILPLMRKIGNLRKDGLKELALTTNGISLYRKLDHMVESGLTGVNISLDTLDPFQYQILTRRQGFSAVMKSIDRVKEMNKLGAGVKLKVNCVVMRGLNDHQILPFVEMTRTEDVEVRFIEYMPFGGNKWSKNKMMSYTDMLGVIEGKYPSFQRLKDAKNDTSKTWQVAGHVGRVGFITSMTHNFCGTCNRLRITSDGNLKVCLHGNTEVSLRDMIRVDHEPMDEAAVSSITLAKQQQLLEVIGAAVKRKKAKHAGPVLPRSSTRSSFVHTGYGSPNPFTAKAISQLVASNSFSVHASQFQRHYSTRRTTSGADVVRRVESSSRQRTSRQRTLTHVNEHGAAHMVDVGSKLTTKRIAIACARITFSHPLPLVLIRDNANKKGDVLGIARIAGIMAAKKTSDLIPLCHPIAITKVDINLSIQDDVKQRPSVLIEARVDCVGNTGVEMEALTAATIAGLTIYDMCKAVDRSMVIDMAEVVYKSGGRSGTWRNARA